MSGIDLSTVSVDEFDRGTSPLKEAIWIIIRLLLFHLYRFSFSRLKCLLLRLFSEADKDMRASATFGPWNFLLNGAIIGR